MIRGGPMLAVMGITLALCRAAVGFNELGHSVIAKVAYDKLHPSQRAAIHDVLKDHPHYAQYLIANKPSGVGDEQWAIIRAATWSDWVRGNHRDQYHKSVWHYLNYPYRMGQSTATLPDALKQRRNVQERLPKAIKMVQNGASTNSLGLIGSLPRTKKRAVALTWLFHLVGDMHQPLHVTAMVDESRWPASSQGDQGGNLIAVVVNGMKPVKLHSYWDGALELPMSHANVRSVVDSFATDPPFAPAELTTLGKQLNLEDWAEEGYTLAARYCYLDGTLQLAPWRDDYDQDGAVAGPEVPVLPEAVKNAARKVYRQRLVLAGERLANQLKEIFP